jgi:hypothetical protein
MFGSVTVPSPQGQGLNDVLTVKMATLYFQISENFFQEKQFHVAETLAFLYVMKPT